MSEYRGQQKKMRQQAPLRTGWRRGFFVLMFLLSAIPAAHGLTPERTPSQSLAAYGRQSWQTDSGLPQSTVHAILQSRDGFLWIATEGGLVRYDGADFRVFNTANSPAITSDTINDLAEDAAGDLWVATSDGLVEQSVGETTLRRYTMADGLPSNVVRALRVQAERGAARSKPDRLVVLTALGVAVSAASGRPFAPVQGLEGDIPATLMESDAQGTLWIATPSETVRTLGPGEITSQFAFHIPAAIGEVQTIAIAPATTKAQSAALWVGGTNGLAQLNPERAARVVRPTPSPNVTALLAAPDGTLWVGTESGLMRYGEGSTAQPTAVVGSRTSVGVSPSSPGRILKLFRDRRGAIWVAGESGLSRVADGAVTPRLEAPLNLPDILVITEDREGNLWFGSDTDGLTVLREQAIHTVSRADGLSDDFIRSILQASDGSVWIGTNRGGLDHMVGSVITSLEAHTAAAKASQSGFVGHGQALTSNVILALADAAGDRNTANHTALWIGTPDGLARIEDGRLHPLTMADGLTDDFVRSLYTDMDGSLWIGTRNGLSHLVDGRLTNYSRLDGLGSDLIGTVLRTRARDGHSGSLWVGTLGGLSRFDGSVFKTFTHSDGLAGNAITTLAEDGTGTLWIAVHGAGLTRLKDGVFTPIDSQKAGLPVEVFSILQQKEDATTAASSRADANLWLGTSQGIYRISLDTLNALAEGRAVHPDVTRFGVADGMAISECSSGGHPAAWAMADGSLWFATLRGIATLRPGSGYENRTPPLVAIEEVSVDERVEQRSIGESSAGLAAGEPGLTLAPGENRLAIRYAGLSFAAPAKVRFRYRLIGFDRDWVEAGSRRTAYYTNLPPGTYRFEVMATNNDGVWSLAPATLSLHQRPHVYQTVWFYMLVILAAAVLLFALYRWRANEVNRRYQLVLKERTRIAREIHDTLAQGYVGISVQLELVSRLLSRSSLGGQTEARSKAVEAAAAQLEATKALVRSSLAEARSSIWQLRASAGSSNQTEALPDRIAASIERLRLQHPHPNATNLKMKVQGTTRALEPGREAELVRIAEEAVTNALRHADATEIVLTLAYARAGLTLRVADDGRGFVSGAVPEGHFGLKGMRERAAAIGAELWVKSYPAAGVEQLAAGVEEPATGVEQPATGVEQPATGAQEPDSGTIVEVRCALDHERGTPDA